MEKAKGRKNAVSPTLGTSSPAAKFIKEEVIERKIKKLSIEAVYFIIAFAVLALFAGLFGTAGVMAAINKGTVPFYRTNSTLTGSSNLFNNGSQIGIGSGLWNFGNRNPLNSDKSLNGVLTIDGDIKLSKIQNVPALKEDRLYNLNGDLWWNAVKIGIWTSEVLPTSTPTTTFPNMITLGKVGIGTNDPKVQLHVKSGDAGGYPAFITPADTFLLEGSDYAIMQMLSGGKSGEQGSYIEFSTSTKRGAAYIGYRNAENAIVFGHNGGTAENMRITSDGNVLASGAIIANASIRSNSQICLWSVNGYCTVQFYKSGEDSGYLYAKNDITASGNISGNNVSAGNHISASTITAGTSIFAGTTIVANSWISTNEDVYARGVKLTSDARLKENVCMINDSLDKIKKLDGVSFNFKNNKNQKELGFIAQDVEKVLPELVGTDTKGYKTLNYDGVIPVLVNAMKEQQQQIDQLKAEVEKLKTQK